MGCREYGQGGGVGVSGDSGQGGGGQNNQHKSSEDYNGQCSDLSLAQAA